MLKYLALGVAGLVLFGWGMAAGEYGIFPYEPIRQVKNLIDGEDGARDPSEYVGSPETREIGLGDAVWGTNADVVMLGDSITANGRWHEMFPEVDIANRGIGGDTVLGVRDRLPAVLAAKPEKIFLLIGTNDVLHRNPEAKFLAYYDDVLGQITRSGAQVYAQSIPMCSDSPACDADLRGTIARLNDAIRRLAAKHDATYIDLNPRLSTADGLRPELTWDGLHLNAEGFRVWREVLRPYIEG